MYSSVRSDSEVVKKYVMDLEQRFQDRFRQFLPIEKYEDDQKTLVPKTEFLILKQEMSKFAKTELVKTEND